MNTRLSCRIYSLSTLFLFLSLAAEAFAQSPFLGTPTFAVTKQPNYIQTDPVTLAPRGGNVWITIVSISYYSSIAFQFRLEVAGAAYPFAQGAPTRKSFVTMAEMERAFPSNSTGRVVATWTGGQDEWAVNIPRVDLLPADPVIINFAALQTWEGGPLRISWNLPPLFRSAGGPSGPIAIISGPGASQFNFYLYRAESIDFGLEAKTVGAWTAPAAGITLDSIQASPGETLYGELRGASTDNIGWIRFPIRRAAAIGVPVVASNPQSQTVLEGQKVTLSVQATGPLLTYQWSKDDLPIAGAVNSTLELPAVSASAAGRYTVLVTNAGGQAVSEPATLTVLVAPKIAAGPSPKTITAGSAVAFTVNATGTSPLSYQWLRSGIPIPGATAAELSFSTTRLADSGSYAVTITNLAGSITSSETALVILPVSRISNISIRSQVGGSGGLLTLGLAIGGVSTEGLKPLLVRAVGPTLAAFGVDPVLPDPRLALMKGQTTVAQNDDWSGDAVVATTSASVGAFNFSHPTSKDAAFVHPAPSGNYTVQITGATDSGIALAEIYDATPSNDFTNTMLRLTNVSALTRAGTSDDTLVAGFSISGATSKTVLIRGIGPALAAFGVTDVLNDPKLELYQYGVATALVTNDNWGSSPNAPEIVAAATSVAAFALAPDSRDAVILATLPPGSYTAQVSGADNSTGTALVEVYEIP